MAHIMRPPRWLILGVLALLVGACAGQVSEMPTWLAFGEYTDDGVYTDEGLVVLKVTPPASILLATGRIEQDGWREKSGSRRVWLAAQAARDGYVVFKVSPAQLDVVYAVVEVRPDSLSGPDPSASGREAELWAVIPEKAADHPAYAPTEQARIPAFKASAARVTFAGAIRITPMRALDSNEPPRKVGITLATSPDDLEAARRFLAEHYPKVTARIVVGSPGMVRGISP